LTWLERCCLNPVLDRCAKWRQREKDGVPIGESQFGY
jgi:hypothetical protein